MLELPVGLVVIPSDGRLLQRSVHPFDLAVGPGVVGPGETVLDAEPTPLLLSGQRNAII